MYYVYQLLDPRDGSIFYVGKGKGDRWRAHEREARKGIRSRKCDRIREILAESHSVQCAFKSHHVCETEAYKAEAALIAEIGIENLTNVAPGGVVRRSFAARSNQKITLGSILPMLSRCILALARGRLYMTVTPGSSMDVTDTMKRFVLNVFRDYGPEDVLTALLDRWKKTNPAIVQELVLWVRERRPDLLPPAQANI